MVVDIGPNLTTVLLALVTVLSSLVAAFFAFKANSQSTATHNLVNGRMTQLLTVSNAVARAQGVTAGVAGDLSIPPVNVNPAESQIRTMPPLA